MSYSSNQLLDKKDKMYYNKIYKYNNIEKISKILKSNTSEATSIEKDLVTAWIFDYFSNC